MEALQLLQLPVRLGSILLFQQAFFLLGWPLDNQMVMSENNHMSKTMTELLRKALNDAPSMYVVARDTGIIRASLIRFARGEQSLRLDKADTLAEYFGFETRKKGK